MKERKLTLFKDWWGNDVGTSGAAGRRKCERGCIDVVNTKKKRKGLSGGYNPGERNRLPAGDKGSCRAGRVRGGGRTLII